MINMIVLPRMVRRKNLECGDKSRAVCGSRHRFPSALCAETHFAPDLQSRRRPVKTSASPRLRVSAFFMGCHDEER